MSFFDYHTHQLDAPAGQAIINLPEEALLAPDGFSLRPDCFYSVGIHPWWTNQDVTLYLHGLRRWAVHSQVVAIGECGLDALRGAPLSTQEEVFKEHIVLANELNKPLTIHCVRAYDRLLRLHRVMPLHTTWVIHGFRGKPALAQQMLAAGFHLSFGRRYHEESLRITPLERLHRETDSVPSE